MFNINAGAALVGTNGDESIIFCTNGNSQKARITSGGVVETSSTFGIANVGGSIGGSGGLENWIGLKDSSGNYGLIMKTHSQTAANIRNVGINETNPSNQLHIAGTTSTSAGGLLRLDATTGDNFILFDNTHDSSEWALGYDSSSRSRFDLWHDSGDGSYDRLLSLQDNNFETFTSTVTFDGGTSTLVKIKGDSAGTAGLRLGGDSGQDQCTGFVEVHQDRIHGGGISYNGDGSPTFATGETADKITFYRMNGGARSEVFSYPYNTDVVTFKDEIVYDNSHANHNSYNFMGGLFQAGTSGQNATNAPLLATTRHYGYGYQEAYSTSNGAWTNPYPNLVLGYHTGVQIGGHPNYNGTRFYNDCLLYTSPSPRD